jgi:tRNA(fMet)-specific endonuclease VapC
MAWVLDTNIVVSCLRGKSPAAMQRLHAVPAREVFITSPVLAELLLGAAKSAKPVENRQAVQSFVAPFAVLWPTLETGERYVSIRADLESKGAVISEADFWIAAAALAQGATPVTNNVDEFSRVPGLAVEDWTQPASA